MTKCKNDLAGKLLSLLGIQRCHWCKKYIFLWQSFVGYFHIDLNPNGEHINWVTHAGNCTEMDIKNEEK